ncbi:hypothetical protein V8E54_011179 [Elaphomyces granulatus]
MDPSAHPELGLTENVIELEIGEQRGCLRFYSAILLFDCPLTDGQALTLAQKAYSDMMNQYISGPAPAVMTALLSASRDTVILASSAKKMSGSVAAMEYYNGWSSTSVILNRGKLANSRQHYHRTSGCGEVVALGVWSEAFPNEDLSGMFVLTWGTTVSNPTPRHRSPCSLKTHGKWGCYEVLMANAK